MTGPNPGHAWRAALVAVAIVNTAIVAVPGASNAQATAVAGSAYGYLADVTVPITGGAVRGPAPLATLPPGGTQSVSSASVIAGPATLFTSGPITVKSQATPGPTGTAGAPLPTRVSRMRAGVTAL